MPDTALSRFSKELGPSSAWLIFLGIVLLVGGLVLLALPLFGGFIVTQWVMAIFVIAGVFQLVHAFRSHGWKSRLWQGLSGLVYILGGLIAIVDPLAGATALTIVLGAVFLLDGVIRIGLALSARPMDNWGWVLIGGIVAALVGIYLLFAAGSAMASLAIVGLFAGIAFVFEGIAFLTLGFRVRAHHPR